MGFLSQSRTKKPNGITLGRGNYAIGYTLAKYILSVITLVPALQFIMMRGIRF